MDIASIYKTISVETYILNSSEISYTARIHGRTVQKRSSRPRYYDGVITHLEPDILEYEVKWALENITTNKASGRNGIPGEFKS